MAQKEDTQMFPLHLEESDLKRERALAKGTCHYCGRATPPRELTMDHIVPISRGGRTTKGNVVPCCKECNNAKKQLLAMEWEHYLMQLKHP
jgi:5-methylcytosine-specific restriction endonuclease McrA